MTKEQKEAIAELELEWLKQRGLSFSDLLEDDMGQFVMPEKVYLPDFTIEDADKWLRENPEDEPNHEMPKELIANFGRKGSAKDIMKWILGENYKFGDDKTF